MLRRCCEMIRYDTELLSDKLTLNRNLFPLLADNRHTLDQWLHFLFETINRLHSATDVDRDRHHRNRDDDERGSNYDHDPEERIVSVDLQSQENHFRFLILDF